jgi:hypothetical protein
MAMWVARILTAKGDPAEINRVGVSIPRQSRGLYDVSRSKRLGLAANAAGRMGTT